MTDEANCLKLRALGTLVKNIPFMNVVLTNVVLMNDKCDNTILNYIKTTSALGALPGSSSCCPYKCCPYECCPYKSCPTSFVLMNAVLTNAVHMNVVLVNVVHTSVAFTNEITRNSTIV